MKKYCAWFVVCSVLLCSVTNAQTLLVDFMGSSDTELPVNSSASDFAIADPNVDIATVVNAIDPELAASPASITGVNLSADLSFSGLSFFNGGGFAQGPSGQRNGSPILDGYLIGSETGFFANPASPNPLVTINNLDEIVAGSAVTLTVYSIGDEDDQVAPITFSDGIQTFTSDFTSPTTPFATFNFTASGSDTFEFFADNTATSSNFVAINGFSLTVQPVPEPASGGIIAMIFIGWIGTRRRNR